MNVLTADAFPQSGIEALTAAGCEVRYDAGLKGESLAAAVRDTGADVLVVRSTEVGAEALTAGRLGLVIRAGAGYNTIDVKTASALGIYVSNCPGKNSIAVAELAFGLMLAFDRRIPDQVAELRAGQWSKGEYSKARGLHGRTIGIVGLGQIGREILVRARAFGMHAVAWSRSLTHAEAERLGVAYAETPVEVAHRSDVVTINVAANSETKRMVNAEFLAAMHPGSYLINTSRGSVVDEEALGCKASAATRTHDRPLTRMVTSWIRLVSQTSSPLR